MAWDQNRIVERALLGFPDRRSERRYVSASVVERCLLRARADQIADDLNEVLSFDSPDRDDALLHHGLPRWTLRVGVRPAFGGLYYRVVALA